VSELNDELKKPIFDQARIAELEQALHGYATVEDIKGKHDIVRSQPPSAVTTRSDGIFVFIDTSLLVPPLGETGPTSLPALGTSQPTAVGPSIILVAPLSEIEMGTGSR
jgi:hypothetical protein